MFSPKQFAMNHLGTDELPDTLAMEQVLDLMLAAHTAAGDQRSDLDETRIRDLRKALADIESATKDPVSALVAMRALTNDED